MVVSLEAKEKHMHTAVCMHLEAYATTTGSNLQAWLSNFANCY